MNLRFMRIESILSDLFLTLSQCFSKISQNFNAETFNVFLRNHTKKNGFLCKIKDDIKMQNKHKRIPLKRCENIDAFNSADITINTHPRSQLSWYLHHILG